MSNAKSLSTLTVKLSPYGNQRLFEFLDAVDLETASRFRGWLSSASDLDVNAAAELLNKVPHGREFVDWWASHDRVSTSQAPQSHTHRRDRSPIERLHSQARARSANKDLTIGGAWLLGGLLVTVLSYTLAANSPWSGHFVIATGAILYGALRLFRGLKGG